MKIKCCAVGLHDWNEEAWCWEDAAPGNYFWCRRCKRCEVWHKTSRRDTPPHPPAGYTRNADSSLALIPKGDAPCR